jgi:hypothetical protein
LFKKAGKNKAQKQSVTSVCRIQQKKYEPKKQLKNAFNSKKTKNRNENP